VKHAARTPHRRFAQSVSFSGQLLRTQLIPVLVFLWCSALSAVVSAQSSPFVLPELESQPAPWLRSEAGSGPVLPSQEQAAAGGLRIVSLGESFFVLLDQERGVLTQLRLATRARWWGIVSSAERPSVLVVDEAGYLQRLERLDSGASESAWQSVVRLEAGASSFVLYAQHLFALGTTLQRVELSSATLRTLQAPVELQGLETLGADALGLQLCTAELERCWRSSDLGESWVELTEEENVARAAVVDSDLRLARTPNGRDSQGNWCRPRVDEVEDVAQSPAFLFATDGLCAEAGGPWLRAPHVLLLDGARLELLALPPGCEAPLRLDSVSGLALLQCQRGEGGVALWARESRSSWQLEMELAQAPAAPRLQAASDGTLLLSEPCGDVLCRGWLRQPQPVGTQNVWRGLEGDEAIAQLALPGGAALSLHFWGAESKGMVLRWWSGQDEGRVLLEGIHISHDWDNRFAGDLKVASDGCLGLEQGELSTWLMSDGSTRRAKDCAALLSRWEREQGMGLLRVDCPLPEAVVTVSRAEGAWSRSARCPFDDLLEAGAYHLEVRAEGHLPYAQDLHLEPAQRLELALDLEQRSVMNTTVAGGIGYGSETLMHTALLELMFPIYDGQYDLGLYARGSFPDAYLGGFRVRWQQYWNDIVLGIGAGVAFGRLSSERLSSSDLDDWTLRYVLSGVARWRLSGPLAVSLLLEGYPGNALYGEALLGLSLSL
jgi:hypothetical protein